VNAPNASSTPSEDAGAGAVGAPLSPRKSAAVLIILVKEAELDRRRNQGRISERRGQTLIYEVKRADRRPVFSLGWETDKETYIEAFPLPQHPSRHSPGLRGRHGQHIPQGHYSKAHRDKLRSRVIPSVVRRSGISRWGI
jgi:hypothetical protein